MSWLSADHVEFILWQSINHSALAACHSRPAEKAVVSLRSLNRFPPSNQAQTTVAAFYVSAGRR